MSRGGWEKLVRGKRNGREHFVRKIHITSGKAVWVSSSPKRPRGLEVWLAARPRRRAKIRKGVLQGLMGKASINQRGKER